MGQNGQIQYIEKQLDFVASQIDKLADRVAALEERLQAIDEAEHKCACKQTASHIEGNGHGQRTPDDLLRFHVHAVNIYGNSFTDTVYAETGLAAVEMVQRSPLTGHVESVNRVVEYKKL